MDDFMKAATVEMAKLKGKLKKMEEFLRGAPDGCLKWQYKNGRIYYYQQHKDRKRTYIKKEKRSLASSLAQKQYYQEIYPRIKQRLQELERLINEYTKENLAEIYEKLSPERKVLVLPMHSHLIEQLRAWEEEFYEKNDAFVENLKYQTEQGELVRSKSEVIIANLLFQYRDDILYKYERPVYLSTNGREIVVYPDFTILNVHTGKITYWEHFGRMDDPNYANDFVRKINTYVENGLMPGEHVFMTFESMEKPLDIGVVKCLINHLIL